MFTVHFNPYILLHVGALLSFVALAFRDELKLRAILLAGILFETIFHLLQREGPSWPEVFWNVVTFAMTLTVAIQIAIDRSHFGLTEDEEALFNNFPGLSPGEFRVLLRAGRWQTASDEIVLTQEGEVPGNLYYVLKGQVLIRKGERDIVIGPETFVGEIAFLHGSPASATAKLEPGARFYEWPVSVLKKNIHKRSSLLYAMTRLIGLDMALKVARA